MTLYLITCGTSGCPNKGIERELLSASPPDGTVYDERLICLGCGKLVTVTDTAGDQIVAGGGAPPANPKALPLETPPDQTPIIAAENKATILHARNRWLGETDAFMLPTPSFPSDMPAAVQQAITSNLSEIEAWRKQLRDYPTTVTDWTKPPPLPAQIGRAHV